MCTCCIYVLDVCVLHAVCVYIVFVYVLHKCVTCVLHVMCLCVCVCAHVRACVRALVGIELGTSCMLGKPSTTKCYLQPSCRPL